MDPRPYHYEYRKPRFNNPTFQSINLYGSLYHKAANDRYQAQNPSSFLVNSNFSRQNYQPQRGNRGKQYVQKYQSSVMEKGYGQDKGMMSRSVMVDSVNPELMRPGSNRSNQPNDWNAKQERPSILASYGRNSMVENYQKEQKNPSYAVAQQRISEQKMRSSSGAYDRLNQFSIFQKQQKPYSIIGNYPRSTSTELKKYPKLTLQNKLIEEGRYSPFV